MDKLHKESQTNTTEYEDWIQAGIEKAKNTINTVSQEE